MSRQVKSDTNCWTIGVATTLGWDGDDEARRYMQQLMVRGHTILMAHNWRIRHLKEFYPRSARLLGLNVNKGEEVCVRFREPGQKNVFFPFQEVLCTLLHEITHCRFSRHDRYFWELYAQLSVECERLNVHLALKDAMGQSQVPKSSRENCTTNDRNHRGLACPNGRGNCSSDEPNHHALDAAHGAWICVRCGNVNSRDRTTCDFCSDAQVDEGWDCRRCAFRNYCAIPHCEACGVARRGEELIGHFVIREVRVVPTLPHAVEARRVLGGVADAITPLLRERGWELRRLEECLPPARVARRCGSTFTISVPLRVLDAPSDLLPAANAHALVLHQLAHRLATEHDVRFLEVWLSLLLGHCRALACMTGAAREALGGVVRLTAQLERLLIHNHNASGNIGTLQLGCVLGTRRARSPVETTATHQNNTWNCETCGFRNIAFLLCEMCGMAKVLCIPSRVSTGHSHENPITVD